MRIKVTYLLLRRRSCRSAAITRRLHSTRKLQRWVEWRQPLPHHRVATRSLSPALELIGSRAGVPPCTDWKITISELKLLIEELKLLEL